MTPCALLLRLLQLLQLLPSDVRWRYGFALPLAFAARSRSGNDIKLDVRYGEIGTFAPRREDSKDWMYGLSCIAWRLGVLVQRLT